ncbi:hypothetical protein BDA99DRAFT_10541 [Phascolomyces articulosus]|uniref:Uncharacterized protein n=1 Tax=Phascolomyces articulosus TaxID=60185 RepID=A0AAD5KRM3_9FUNG|nr:hypothetical protein BDA99DRAFT_10541 [Phascolomyces articulosus]
MNNYLSMDRASEAAARDLAEVRKLIEGMSAFVTSQTVQQQQQQQSTPQTTTTTTSVPPATNTTTTATTSADRQSTPSYPTSSQPPQQQSPSNSLPQDTAALMAAAAAAAAAASSSTSTPSIPATATTGGAPATTTSQTNASSAPAPDTYSAQQPPANGIVVQVDHLMFNRTLYFQLAPDATIEPLITGLRLSFNDNSISGMVLQYKGFDGLWKCLLNRDDSLKRILKQGFKSQTMLQMRVPREQDLLSVRIITLLIIDVGSLN